MPNYKRNYKKGGTYFFTVVTGNRSKIFCGSAIDLLRACFKECILASPFHMEAIVVLPDHLHCLWTLPQGDDDYSSRWKRIKASFTKTHIRNAAKTQQQGASLLNNKGEADVWQRRFWEHTIRDDRDFKIHCDYIHYNPVKHGYVPSPVDWPYSSFKKHVAKGFYESDWGAQSVDFQEMVIGE